MGKRHWKHLNHALTALTAAAVLFIASCSSISYEDLSEPYLAAAHGLHGDEAAGFYEEAVAETETPQLYYNLANAYFKAGHHGKAILYYNRALRLAPGDADIRYNLDVANTFTKDRIAVVPEFFLKTWVRTIRSSLGCTAWSLLSLGALALMFILVLVYLLAGRLVWRKTGFYGMLVMFVCFFAFTAFAISERNEQLDSTEAVVMSSSVSVKSSPDKSSTDLFVLHEGTKVRTVNELDDWREIVIADGKKGWVEARTIETI